MSEADRAYYHRRAEEELAYAQQATDEWLVSYHYRLAGFYLDLVFDAHGEPARFELRPKDADRAE
jgi:hypothetical protein